MEKINAVSLCVSLVWLVLECDCQQTSIQRLQDQLRVAKESHALDMRDVHVEIDLLKEKLEEIVRVDNGTDISRTDFLKTGAQFHTTLQMVLRSLDDFEVSEQNYEKSVERLKMALNHSKLGINKV